MRKFTTVYSYDEDGFYCGEADAYHDKNGHVMLPAMSVLEAPVFKDGSQAKLIDGKWGLEVIVIVEDVIEEPVVFTAEEIALRRLVELDGLLESRSARILEDLINGVTVHADTKKLLDEKVTIRLKLKETN